MSTDLCVSSVVSAFMERTKADACTAAIRSPSLLSPPSTGPAAHHAGEYVAGSRSGYGVCRYFNGDYYEGTWADGVRNGAGMQQCMDGSNYVGQYRDAKRDGHGVYTFHNGDCYLGTYAADLPNGIGVYLFEKGQKYMGEWANGKKHGLCDAPSCQDGLPAWGFRGRIVITLFLCKHPDKSAWRNVSCKKIQILLQTSRHDALEQHHSITFCTYSRARPRGPAGASTSWRAASAMSASGRRASRSGCRASATTTQARPPSPPTCRRRWRRRCRCAAAVPLPCVASDGAVERGHSCLCW